jgi:hypothetical protein
MRKAPEIPAQFINPLLDAFLNVFLQCVETVIELMGADLSCRAARRIHGL